jgi:hypothetical protein
MIHGVMRLVKFLIVARVIARATGAAIQG